MDRNPGATLFNDAGSIHVNNTSAMQRAEEEEAIEDQKRRNAELAKQMFDAFDDLVEDDDQNDTLNSFNYLSNYSENPAESPPPLIPQNNGTAEGQRVDSNNTNRRHGPNIAGDGHHIQENIHWKNMFESKCREFEHVTKLLHEKSKEFEKQTGELKKRLLLAEGERDRAEMTRTQTHALLVESKTKISEQEDTLAKVKSKVQSLEEDNLKLETELENKKTMLQDALHKYRMVEQNVHQKADRHTDQLLKQTEEKHCAKITMMQQQIDNMRSELDDRTREVRQFEARYNELKSLRDALLVEKTETVQRLQMNLEESQQRCENLMTKTTSITAFSQDNLRLQTKVNALEQQTHDMQRTINTLTHKLETTNAELEMMDSVLGSNEGHNDSNTFAATHKNLVGSTPINSNPRNTENRIAKLKQELLICMSSQKDKREAIKRLEADLAGRDREIEQLKRDESHALVQMNQYKEEAFRLNSKLKILENELDKCYKKEHNSSKPSRRSSFDKQEVLESKIFELKQEKVDLEDKLSKSENERQRLEERSKKLETDSKALDAVKLELEKNKFLLNDSQGECERLKNLYIEMSSGKDAVARELAALKSQDMAKEVSILNDKLASLERALQLAEFKSSELGKLLEKEKLEHEKLLREIRERHESSREIKDKKQSANSCTKCINSLAEISKLEIQNLQLQNSCATHLREINDLKSALNESRATVHELHGKLDLKAERDHLIDELKEKAAQFEEFMRNQNGNASNSSSGNSSTRDSATSPPPRHLRDQSVNTSPELQELDEMEIRKAARVQEHNIREEMARAFAAEIKVIEEKFKAQFLKFEENINTLKNELHDKSGELHVRNHEVEVLKYAIVTEREKISEILAKKDTDARTLFEKQAEVMKKYKAELDNAQRKVQFLEGELQEKQELIQSERESMDKLVKQITEERKMFHEREIEVIDKFKEIEQEYNKSLEMVTEKYNSVKKTALNYKKYAEDKEQHMLKEYDRIKEGYNAALLKVQNRMKEALENKDRSIKEQISKLQSEYQSKLLKGNS